MMGKSRDLKMGPSKMEGQPFVHKSKGQIVYDLPHHKVNHILKSDFPKLEMN